MKNEKTTGEFSYSKNMANFEALNARSFHQA